MGRYYFGLTHQMTYRGPLYNENYKTVTSIYLEGLLVPVGGRTIVKGSARPMGLASWFPGNMNPAELIQNFLHDRLGIEADRIIGSARLADLGVDSLMLAELMFEAEDRLGISISSDQTPPETVADMVALIDKLLAAKRSSA